MDKIIIRPSSAQEFFTCAYSWYNKYILMLPSKTNDSAAVGTSVHFGAEHFWKDTMLTGQRPTDLDRYIKLAKDKFYDMDGNDELSYIGANLDECLGKVAIGTHLYLTQIAPQLTVPSAVEKRVTYEINHPIVKAVSGTIDYISEEEGLIGDIKTSKRAIIPSSYTLQQSIYFWLANKAGINVNKSMIYGIVFTKEPKTEIHSLEVNTKQAVTLINNMLDALELYHKMPENADTIFRGNPKHYLCHYNWCPKYNNCKFVGNK